MKQQKGIADQDDQLWPFALSQAIGTTFLTETHLLEFCNNFSGSLQCPNSFAQ